MTKPTHTELCERLSHAEGLHGVGTLIVKAREAIEAQAARIEALEAKCALLAASLAQEEKRCASLGAQLKAREGAEPVGIVRKHPYWHVDVTRGWEEIGEDALVYAHHPAAAASDWQAVCAEVYNIGREDGEAETRPPAAASGASGLTKAQVEEYIDAADSELGPRCCDAWVEKCRRLLRSTIAAEKEKS